MADGTVFMELSAGGRTVRIEGLGRHPLFGDSAGIEGWWSTPPSKVSSTERQTGHGAFPVADDEVLYSARTVTVHLNAHGGGRGAVISSMGEINAMAGRAVRLRVADASSDTYADGYLEVEWQAERARRTAAGTLTVVCPDPRRYATDAQVHALVPAGAGGEGGLLFDGAGCMEWPVTFAGEGAAQNAATLENAGTATAYPVIRVQGDFPDGVRIVDGAGGELRYAQPLAWQPLVLDCLSRTASINGVDVTRDLASRDFPTVPPGGTATLALMGSGNGSVEVELRDTYI